MTSLASCSISSQGSVRSSEGYEAKKYILLRDTIAKSKWSQNASSRTRLRSKRSEQRVLKGSLWQEEEENPFNQSLSSTRSIKLGHSSPSPPYKLSLESIEIEDLTLQCASGFLAELADETCRLLLAIPTSEERYLVYSDQEHMKTAKFINVGSDVIVTKRNLPPCRAVVRWKGRLAGKQGVWFGVEIMDEQSFGSGDSDGSVNNIRLFTCEKNNGMFVNISQLRLVPPKRPVRKQRRKAPSTPSQGSEHMTNGSHNSDPLTNDLVSQTESELSFTDDITSADTVPLVNLQVNDRVIWPSDTGYEAATVKWIGTLPEEESLQGEILVGVEFDNPIGKGTGVYKNRRLFETKKGHASLVPLEGLVKISPQQNLDNISQRSGATQLSTSSRESEEANQIDRAADILNSLGIDDQDLNNNGRNSSSKNSQSQSPLLPQRPCHLDNRTSAICLSTPDVVEEMANTEPNHLSATRSACCSVGSQASLSSSDNLANDQCLPVKMTSASQSYDPVVEENCSEALDFSEGDSSQMSTNLFVEEMKSNTKPKINGLIDLKPKYISKSEFDVVLNKVFDSTDGGAVSGAEGTDSASTTNTDHSRSTGLQKADADPHNNTNFDELTEFVCKCDDPDVQKEDAYVLVKVTPQIDSQLPQFASNNDDPINAYKDITVSDNHITSTKHNDIDSINDDGLSSVPLPEPAPDSSLTLSESFSDVPEPPAEFTTNSNMSCNHVHLNGIRDLFTLQTERWSHYPEVQQHLIEHIYKPLINNTLVEAAVMMRWRELINDLSVGQMLRSAGQRDIQKFIRLVLEHICSLRPLYELNNDQTGYTMTLTSYKDARIGFPTVQKLLEKTCIQQQVKFNQVPKTLILILPRWPESNEKIFPNLHVDLTDVLEHSTRICHMCGDQAMFECPECYETETVELASAAFCEKCSLTIHKHSKRANHMPVQLRHLESTRGLSTCPILKLTGILSLHNGQFTSLSEQFVESTKRLSESQMLIDETEWLWFDSKSIVREDGSCVPEVKKVWGTTKWLSMDGYEHMAKDMLSIPPHNLKFDENFIQANKLCTSDHMTGFTPDLVNHLSHFIFWL